MPFRFHSVQAMRSAHGPTFAAWGRVLPAPPERALSELASVRCWATHSATAQRILDTIDMSPVSIVLIAIENGGDTVFSRDDPVPGVGTIYWNLGGRAGVRQDGGGVQAMHPYIVFLHECGHAVQWLENPAFFGGNMLHGRDGQRMIHDAAAEFWRNRHKAQHPNARYPEMNAAAEQQMASTQPNLDRPSWNVRVEVDNLLRHEWPMCAETGNPRRTRYTDLVPM